MPLIEPDDITLGSEENADKLKINVWLIAKQYNFPNSNSEYTTFQNRDNVIIPAKLFDKFLKSSSSSYIVRIANIKTKDYTFARVISSNNTIRDICMPNSIFDLINVKEDDKVNVEYVELPKIKKVIFQVPSILTNPKPILEFELQKISVLHVKKEIIVKIFECKFVITVKKMIDLDGVNTYVASIVGHNDIDFEIEFV